MLYSDISIRNRKLNRLKFVDIALSSRNKLYIYELLKLYIQAFEKRTAEKSKERYVKFEFNGILKKKMAKKTIELVASGTRIQSAKNVILSVEHTFRIKKEKNKKSSLHFYRLERYTSRIWIRRDMDKNRIKIKRDTNVVDTDDRSARNRDS